MRKYIFIILSTLTISFLSFCDKNVLTKPSSLQINFKIADAPAKSGKFIFDKGFILMENFEFEGIREIGNNIAFTNKFQDGFYIDLALSTNLEMFSYDIPQGVYQKILLRLTLFSKSTDIIEKPRIEITGKYIINGTSTPIKIQCNFDEILEMNVKNNLRTTNTLTISSENRSTITVSINPYYWFQVITDDHLSQIELTNISGTDYILINEQKNQKIFSLIILRIKESTTALFE